MRTSEAIYALLKGETLVFDDGHKYKIVDGVLKYNYKNSGWNASYSTDYFGNTNCVIEAATVQVPLKELQSMKKRIEELERGVK